MAADIFLLTMGAPGVDGPVVTVPASGGTGGAVFLPSGVTAVIQAAGDIWLSVEEGLESIVIGGEVSFSWDTIVMSETRALESYNGEVLFLRIVADDCLTSSRVRGLRVQPVMFYHFGRPKQVFESANEEMTADKREGGLDLDDPPTCGWFLHGTKELGEAAIEHMWLWGRTNNLAMTAQSWYEMEALTKELEVAFFVDQLDLPTLKSFEFMFRHIAVHGEAFKINLGSPGYSDSDLAAGWFASRYGFAFQFTSHVAFVLRAGAAESKEAGKARGEHQTQFTRRGGGPSRGKGRGDVPDGGQASAQP